MRGTYLTGSLAIVGFLMVSTLILASFNISITTTVNRWRQLRIAMYHSHLAVSEQFQDQIGIVDSVPEPPKTADYEVTYQLMDSEELEEFSKDMEILHMLAGSKTSTTGAMMGSIDYAAGSMGSTTYYALPTVRKDNGQFAYFVTIINAQSSDTHKSEDYEELVEIYKEQKEIWATEGAVPW